MFKKIFLISFIFVTVSGLAIAQECPQILYQTNEEGTYFSSKDIFKDGQSILVDVLSGGSSQKLGPFNVAANSKLSKFVNDVFLEYGDDVRTSCTPQVGSIGEAPPESALPTDDLVVNEDTESGTSDWADISNPAAEETGTTAPEEAAQSEKDKKFEDVVGKTAVCLEFNCVSSPANRKTRNKIDVVFLVDISGTMGQLLPDGTKRIENAKKHLSASLAKFDSKLDRVGVVTFGNKGVVVSGGFDNKGKFEASKKTIQALVAGDRTTNIADGLRQSINLFNKNSRKDGKKVLILLSDGVPNRSTQEECNDSYPISDKNNCVVDARLWAKKAAKDNGIELYVVGYALKELQDSEGKTITVVTNEGTFGVPVPKGATAIARQLLRDMANGDHFYFESENLSDLNGIMGQIIEENLYFPPPVCSKGNLLHNVEIISKNRNVIDPKDSSGPVKFIGREKNGTSLKWGLTAVMQPRESIGLQIAFAKDMKTNDPRSLLDLEKSYFQYFNSENNIHTEYLKNAKIAICSSGGTSTTTITTGKDVSLVFDKKISAESNCQATVTYTVECVGDKGAGKCTNIKLTDQFPGFASILSSTIGGQGGNSLSFDVGSLEVGEKRSYTLILNVEDNGADVGSAGSEASLNYSTFVGGKEVAKDPIKKSVEVPHNHCGNTIIEKKDVSLEIAKTVEQLPNCRARITNTVKCIGQYKDYKCLDVRITDNIPADVKYIQASAEQPQLAGGKISYKLGEIIPGSEPSVFSYEVELPQASTTDKEEVSKVVADYFKGEVTNPATASDEKNIAQGAICQKTKVELKLGATVESTFLCQKSNGEIVYTGRSNILVQCTGNIDCRKVVLEVNYNQNTIVDYSVRNQGKGSFIQVSGASSNILLEKERLVVDESDTVVIDWTINAKALEDYYAGLKAGAKVDFMLTGKVSAGSDIYFEVKELLPNVSTLERPSSIAACRQPEVSATMDSCTECEETDLRAISYLKGEMVCGFKKGCDRMGLLVNVPKEVSVEMLGTRDAKTGSYSKTYKHPTNPFNVYNFGDKQYYEAKLIIDKAKIGSMKDFDVNLQYLAYENGKDTLTSQEKNYKVNLPLEELCGCYRFNGNFINGSDLKESDFDIRRYVVVVADVSESINLPPGSADRQKYLESYKYVLRNIYNSLNISSGKDHIGLVEVGGSNEVANRLSDKGPVSFTQKRGIWDAAVNGLSFGGKTNLARGINFANGLFAGNARKEDIKIIVVLSDGIPNLDGGYTSEKTKNIVAKKECGGAVDENNYNSDQCFSAAVGEAQAIRDSGVSIYSAWYIYESAQFNKYRDTFSQTPIWPVDKRDIQDKKVARKISERFMRQIGYFQGNSAVLPGFEPESGASALVSAFGCSKDSNLTVEGKLPASMKYSDGSANANGNRQITATITDSVPQQFASFLFAGNVNLNYKQFSFSFNAAAPFGLKEVPKTHKEMKITCFFGRKLIQNRFDMDVTKELSGKCQMKGKCFGFLKK